MKGRVGGPGGRLPGETFFLVVLEEEKKLKSDFREKQAQREMRMMNQTSMIDQCLECRDGA